VEGLVRASAWMMRVLHAARAEPGAWVGAGVLRDLVWGERYGSGFEPARVRDVDVAYFDPHDLSGANDDRVTVRLGRRLPGVPWEAKNQAAVHTCPGPARPAPATRAVAGRHRHPAGKRHPAGVAARPSVAGTGRRSSSRQLGKTNGASVVTR
jgi:hypothetical protein